MTSDISTDVLVVGAGPVGLALAIEIASRGHKVHIIEKADRIGRQPRAKTTNVRTMEHMRRWGLAEKVRAASPLPPGYANRMIFATGMFGKEITAFENSSYCDRVRDERFSEAGQWIPQYEIEGVLRDHAVSFKNCTLAFSLTLTSFREDAEGVTADIAASEGGARTTIRARYLIGADGVRSTVRQSLGIKMDGAGRIGNLFLSLILRVPGLGQKHKLREALMYWLVNPASPGIFGPMDKGDTWFWGTQVPPDAPMDAETNIARVQKTLGKDIPFEIVATDVWTALSLQASSYGTARVQLAGDACHLHPPFGGYGMNLGIADAVDLGWKLSALLEGWGGKNLLASYETERRPVHKRVIDESVENMAMLAQHFLNPRLDDDDAGGIAAREDAAEAIQKSKDREFHSLGLVIGYDYFGSPLLVPDGAALPPVSVTDYIASAAPGRRAPHAWLKDGSSLFDHFGPGFTLLHLGEGGEADIAGLVAAARAAKVPLKTVRPNEPALQALYGARLALIRPDQHVAWRGDGIGDAGAIVSAVRGC